MSSPLNQPSVTAWFARLDAAWRRMPAEERTCQREEIEQHLEGLVAAKVAEGQPPQEAWEAALVQFGDPTQIGRKMYQEWQQGKTGFRADMTAIVSALILYIFAEFARQKLFILWVDLFYDPRNQLATHGAKLTGLASFAFQMFGFTGDLIVGTVIGRKYPFQAIKSAFWARITVFCLYFVFNIIAFLNSRHSITVHMLFLYVILTSLFLLRTTGIAYLASVTKRGWYRPSLADFKIMLPRRRVKVAQ